MHKIPVRQFKGLLSYGDLADTSLEYANIFENTLVYPGYIESKKINFNKLQLQLPTNESISTLKYVFIDIDKFQNEYVGILLKRTYQQNITKKQLLITEKQIDNNQSEYKFYLDEELLSETHLGKPDQTPYIENINGIVKIFFYEKSYWLSEFNRIRFSYEQEDLNISGHKLKQLIYQYNQLNKFPFDIEAKVTDDYIIEGNLEKVGRFIYEDNGMQFAILSYRIKDNSGKTIIYPSRNGLLNFILARTRNKIDISLDGNIVTIGYYTYWFLINEREKDIITNLSSKTSYIKTQSGNLFNFYRTMEPDWSMFEAPNSEKFYIWKSNNSFTDINIPLTGWQFNALKVQSFSNDFKFNAATKGNFLATINTSQGEFVHSTFELEPLGQPYLFKIKTLQTEFIPEEATQINLYLSTIGILDDEQNILDKREYEMVLSISLIEGKKISFPIYIDQTTPNGIMLSQRIGTLFNKQTYQLEDGFSFYKTINGVSFAIKNDRIYYPAVGNAQVLNNIFYNYNYIPNIEGQILSYITKKLAVIDTNKNITQIIDFQPLENNLIFIPVIDYDIRVKNYFDIIETPEGTLINNSEGILLIANEQRTFISNQIKDIVKNNFNKSSIFYNNHLKELYYTFDNELYIYRFETQSWSYFKDLNKPDFRIKDASDDYNGIIYFIIYNERNKKDIYNFQYTAGNGKIGYKNIDFDNASLKKSLYSISIDYEGKVKFLNSNKESLKRKVDNIPVPFLKRKFKDFIEFEIEFNGKIYSFELFLEAIPYIRY